MNHTTLKEKWEDLISLCFKLSYKMQSITKRVLFHICPSLVYILRSYPFYSSIAFSFLSFLPCKIVQHSGFSNDCSNI